MNRRIFLLNYILNFFLWILSFFFGYKIANSNIKSNSVLSEKSTDTMTFVVADKTGSVSASEAINLAISNMNDGDYLHFQSGTYLIDKPIIWSKKVTLIAVGKVTLKAIKKIPTVFKISDFTTYTSAKLLNFYIDGNKMANHCITLDSAGGLYVTKFIIDNCEFRNAILDGILINPPAWSIKITNSLSNSHGRDGIRAIITDRPSTNQINDIKLENCTINDNISEGINILGTAISIDKCDIENNNIGVRIDAAIHSVVYDSFHINVTNSYIEGNKTNQIYVATNTGDGIILNIERNYFNSVNIGEAIIKCKGIAEAITLNIGKNRFQSSNKSVILDGGNCLNSSSLITSDVYLNEPNFINLGYARVQFDRFNVIMLPASISTLPSTSVHTTDNLVIRNPKKVEYPVLVDMQWKVLKLLSARIITNATAYNLTCTVKIINLAGGEVHSVSFIIVGEEDKEWNADITNEWGFYRIPSGHFVLVSFLLNGHTADGYVTINNVSLSYI